MFIREIFLLFKKRLKANKILVEIQTCQWILKSGLKNSSKKTFKTVLAKVLNSKKKSRILPKNLLAVALGI
jgi:hypothetical protein